MSGTNQGSQSISWKYKTPLIAENLSKILGHFSSEGLCDIDVDLTTDATKLMIKKCSMLVKPTEFIGNKRDPVIKEGSRDEFLFKVTTSDVVTINGIKSAPFNTDYLILTYSYTFTNGDKKAEQWYGSFQLYTPTQFYDKFIDDGVVNKSQDIILGVCYKKKDSSDYAFTTNGADWSDVALFEMGYDPNCWISVQSPRRAFGNRDAFYFGTSLEVRKHNELKNDFTNTSLVRTLSISSMSEMTNASNTNKVYFSVDGNGLTNGVSSYSISNIVVKKPEGWNGDFKSIIIEPRTYAPSSPFSGITNVKLVDASDWSSESKNSHTLYIVK